MPDFDAITIGESLPPLQLPPLSRFTLALYCGASGDHNPIHVDIDYARNVAGRDDVIGHGSLTMAYLGRMLANRVPLKNVRRFSVRLHAPTRIGDAILCTGKVIEKIDKEEKLIRVALRAETGAGICLASGEAVLVF
ncbi:MAG: MaoC/PaaZ C-terminal domain-containing protein [Balneolaceae bacterium]